MRVSCQRVVCFEAASGHLPDVINRPGGPVAIGRREGGSGVVVVVDHEVLLAAAAAVALFVVVFVVFLLLELLGLGRPVSVVGVLGGE